MITVIVRDTITKVKKIKHVSAILEVYMDQLATRQANEGTHLVSIYLLLIQFKIPAERSTFLCRKLRRCLKTRHRSQRDI